MPSQFSGLPDQPLSKTQVNALNDHDTFEFCYPVSHLPDDPDSIVELTLGIGDDLHVLCYNPVDEQWERVTSASVPDETTETAPVEADVVDEHLAQYYDVDDLQPVGNTAGVVSSVVSGLPNEPLEEEQLVTLARDHPKVANVKPLAEGVHTNRTLGIMFFVDDRVNERRFTAVAGFDPDADSWQLIETVTSDVPNLKTALSDLRGTFEAWLTAAYPPGEIRQIQNPSNVVE